MAGQEHDESLVGLTMFRRTILSVLWAFVAVFSFAASIPVAAQAVSTSSSSTGGGTSGPCQSSSQPDVCVPINVPEPDSALPFIMGISTFLIARWLGRRRKGD